MSLKSCLFLSLVACTMCANAYIVARFDLGVTGSPVATGWQPVAVGLNSDDLTSVSGTQAGTTLTVFANTVLDARDRGVPATSPTPYDNETLNPGGSLTPVLQDWLFDNGNTQGENLTVEFTGLIPETEYRITSIHFEISGGQIDFVTDWYKDEIAPANLLGTWTGVRGGPVDSGDFVLLNATSDATGKITLVADAVTGPLRLNGFTVEQVPPVSDTIYQIDLDNSESLGGPFTEPGWTSLPLVNGSTSGSVDISGVNFAVSGFAGSRNRTNTANSTTLTRDFVFSNGAAITMAFGGAGDLPTGLWEVSMWSWDTDVPVAPATVGYRVNSGSDVVVSTGLAGNPAYPVSTFQITSDGASSYEVFIRSDTLSGNVRLNAVSLRLVPPTSTTPKLVDFTYGPGDGSAAVSIEGAPNTRYKLVEADDLDFSSPDQDPISLTGATVGSLDGDEVIADGNGNATVQFNLGATKAATFIRAETVP